MPAGQVLAQEHGHKLAGMDERDWLPVVKEVAIDAMMALVRDDLAALNVHHDVFYSERSLHQMSGQHNLIDKAIGELETKGLIYRGTLPPPKGQIAGGLGKPRAIAVSFHRCRR